MTNPKYTVWAPLCRRAWGTRSKEPSGLICVRELVREYCVFYARSCIFKLQLNLAWRKARDDGRHKT